jgi:hypothetical protein
MTIEEPFDTVDGDPLDPVDVLAAAVVAPPRIALGVLVGQHRSLRFHDGQRAWFSEAIISRPLRWRRRSVGEA